MFCWFLVCLFKILGARKKKEPIWLDAVKREADGIVARNRDWRVLRRFLLIKHGNDALTQSYHAIFYLDFYVYIYFLFVEKVIWIQLIVIRAVVNKP